MRTLITFLLALHLAAPSLAQEAAVKDPFSYSVKYYAMILGIAILGGLASWWSKVRRGEIPMTSISHLAGELVISAFSGILCFWICSAYELHPLLTAAFTGLSGHMGTRGISLLESWAMKKIPLGDK
jgi:hypothetical protein